MAREQRSEQRTPVDMVLNKYVNGEPHLCRAVNLSRGGMLLRKIFEPELAHHAVLLEFQLPGTEQVLRVEGVALMESPEARTVGVRFTNLSAEAETVLATYLRGGARRAVSSPLMRASRTG